MIVDLGVMSAQQNMDSDYQRLKETKSSDSPSLRFYRWREPSLTYGYFSKPLDAAIDQGKRPTGGGILFHTTDLAFSILLPDPKHASTLANYRFVNEIVQNALFSLGFKADFLEEKMPNSSFCMAEPTKYDLVIDHKKVVGSAQRRVKEALLHQGTISLKSPGDFERACLKDDRLFHKMQQETYPLNLSASIVEEALTEAFHFSLKSGMLKS